MPLETGSTISDLNVSNPAATDGLGQADDHLRLIKTALKTTFPNFTGVLSATQAQLDAVVSSMFVGSMHSFPKARADIASSNSGAAVSNPATINFLECDGSAYLVSDFPTLGAYLGQTYGGSATAPATFGVPNLKDTGRFIRSRTASVSVGTYQTNAFKAHTHDVIGSSGVESVGHIHSFSGSGTGSTSADGSHTHNISGGPTATSSGSTQTAQNGTSANTSITTDAAGTHTHSVSVSVSGVTSDISQNHTHFISLTSQSTGSTETRPEAFSAIIAIKT